MNIQSVLDSLSECKGPATLWLEANSEVIRSWKLEDEAQEHRSPVYAAAEARKKTLANGDQ